MLIAVGLLLIGLLTLATAYFVAQEFAYVAVDRSQLKHLADRGDAPALRALRVTGRLSFMLSGAQLGITVTALLVGYVAEPYLGEGLAVILGAAGVPTAVSLSVSIVVALLVATAIQMVFGELAPKNLAITNPVGLARRLSRSTLIYLAVAGPVIRVFDAAANRLLRAVGIEPVEELPQGATREDLTQIVAEALDSGQLDADTARLLDAGLDFRKLIAAEVMVPRVDVITLQAGDPSVRLVELLSTGHSRFPVIEHSIDDVLGTVSIAEVLAIPAPLRRTTPVGDIAVPATRVPASAPLPLVLERLRAAHRQLAVVMDEYGGFAGVITLEDIAEELVGQIRDEDDLPEPTAHPQPDGSWQVPGRWRLDEIADATGIHLPEAETYDTVSGLMLQRLGRVAAAGDHIDVELPQPQFGQPPQVVRLTAMKVDRHVPSVVTITVVGQDRA